MSILMEPHWFPLSAHTIFKISCILYKTIATSIILQTSSPSLVVLIALEARTPSDCSLRSVKNKKRENKTTGLFHLCSQDLEQYPLIHQDRPNAALILKELQCHIFKEHNIAMH